MKADIQAVTDRGEAVSLMEPMRIAEGSPYRGELTDLAVGLAARSAGFRHSLPEGVPNRFRARIQLWVEEEIRLGALPAKAGNVLDALLYRGELPRGEVGGLLGTSDRHARRVVSALIERGVLTSESPRAALQIAFPAELSSRWMPGVFPERVI